MAIQHLSITDFAQCPVPVPAAHEQVEIVRRVDELLALADSFERKRGAAAGRVEKLTPSVLTKAFRGELLSQDPNDEPAEKLLERILSAPGSSRQGHLQAREAPRSIKLPSGKSKRPRHKKSKKRATRTPR